MCAQKFFKRHRHTPRAPPHSSSLSIEHTSHRFPGLDKVYVVHYDKNAERRQHLEPILARMGLDPLTTWVTWNNKEDLAHLNEEDTRILSCFIKGPECAPAPDHKCYLWQPEKIGVASSVMKTLWIYQEMLRSKQELALVIEDDARFNFDEEDISNRIHDLLHQGLPEDFTTVMLGGCCKGKFGTMHANMSAPGHPGLHGPGFMSRSAVGYLISQRGARMMLNHVFKVLGGAVAGADVGMAYVVNDGGYWLEPPLWYSGSDMGTG